MIKFFALMLVLAFCFSRAEAAIVLNEKTDIKIKLGSDFGNTAEAIQELVERHMKKALKRDKLAAKGGESFSIILKAKAKTWNGLDKKEISDITDLDKVTITITEEPEKQVVIEGNTVVATGFGLMIFLEEDIGITWLFPGRYGVAYPRKKTITLKTRTKSYKPSYVSRVYTGITYRDKKIFKRIYKGTYNKNKFFFGVYDYLKALKLHQFSSASHNMINIFPVKESEINNPEIFPMKDGKRHIPDVNKRGVGNGQCWHPCYSNPKTFEITIKKAKACYTKDMTKRGAHMFSLGINDGRRLQCECPECKKQGWPNSYYNYVKKVAIKLKEFYPPHMVGLIAYGDVRQPPEDLDLPDNVMVQITNANYRQLENWSKHAKNLGVYEYNYGYGYWIPNFPLKLLKQNAQIFKKFGVKFYHNESHPMWAFDWPKMKIMSELMWDNDMDVYKALKKYCDRGFGKAGSAIYNIYLKLASLRDIDAQEGKGGGLWSNAWRNSSLQFSEVNQELFDYIRQMLNTAKKRAQYEDEKKRVEMLNTFFSYSEMLFKMYTVKNEVFESGEDKNWQQLLRRIKKLKLLQIDLKEQFKKNPEWFVGASAKRDHFINDDIDRFGSWTLATELANAEQICKMHLSIRPIIHLKKSHPWYKNKFLYHNINAVKTDNNNFTFKSVTPELKPEKHRKPHAQFKDQYLVAFSTKLPYGVAARYYKNIVKFKGKNGKLTATISILANNSSRPIISQIKNFGSEAEEGGWDIILKPAMFDKKTKKTIPYPEKPIKGMMDIYLRWKPNNKDSFIDGNWYFDKHDHVDNAPKY